MPDGISAKTYGRVSIPFLGVWALLYRIRERSMMFNRLVLPSIHRPMTIAAPAKDRRHPKLRELTKTWGSESDVDLYLGRCQVDTPSAIVAEVWKLLHANRTFFGSVVDFGAGDARFAVGGSYGVYTGYEIDKARIEAALTSDHVRLLNTCAFSARVGKPDLCIGNPPYVRNQDLPEGWRQKAAKVLLRRSNVILSGLANAWQYFFLLGLSTTADNGMVALVMPYEWVSRPSSAAIRQYITNKGWGVAVYRLRDDTFSGVLTTASITIVDKASADGNWQYFAQTKDSTYRTLTTPSGHRRGVVEYSRRKTTTFHGPFAQRGLSPGTQEALVLTEAQRVDAGLHIGTDVVRCVTSLRPLPENGVTLTSRSFNRQYVKGGRRCWLIRTDAPPSDRLRTYLKGVPGHLKDTATCTNRLIWWQFTMPSVPTLLAASGFRGKHPKIFVNQVGAIAVGAVYGIHGALPTTASTVRRRLLGRLLKSRVVAHSHGLRKLEVAQYNTLLGSSSSRGKKPNARL